MSDQPSVMDRAGAENVPEHWTARHGKSIIFVILTLVAAGIYLAFSIPVAVFPATTSALTMAAPSASSTVPEIRAVDGV